MNQATEAAKKELRDSITAGTWGPGGKNHYALKVACPPGRNKCSAPVGEPCQTWHGGMATEPHADRVRAAQMLEFEDRAGARLDDDEDVESYVTRYVTLETGGLVDIVKELVSRLEEMNGRLEESTTIQRRILHMLEKWD